MAISSFQKSSDYIRLDSIQTASGILAAWQSNLSDDPNWDGFLAGVPKGHFYQTSMWAQTRILDGWKAVINIITLDDTIVGGFQILIRSKSYAGNIGLVLKGPVVNSDNASIVNFVINVLKKTARSNRIKALIVQPPDRDAAALSSLAGADFSPNHLEHVVKNNTVVIDLRGTEEEVFKAIKRTKRQNINTAIRNGVLVREGSKDDLETFFRFMVETCNRQQVSPSPSNKKFLDVLWDKFSPSGNVKLFVSEYAGEDVSCLVVIPLGETAYLWKFGWSGQHAKLFPNLIIYWEIFKWARANGLKYADLGAIGKDLADTIWRGEPISDEQAKTYSYFKVSFGGEVVQLNEGLVYIYNPLIRWVYNTFMPYINSNPFLKKRLLFKNE